MRVLALLYGVGCYGVFLLTLLYAIGFVGGFGVPQTVDAGGPSSPAGLALAVNAGLLGMCGLQHSLMARQGFKRLWRYWSCARRHPWNWATPSTWATSTTAP